MKREFENRKHENLMFKPILLVVLKGTLIIKFLFLLVWISSFLLEYLVLWEFSDKTNPCVIWIENIFWVVFWHLHPLSLTYFFNMGGSWQWIEALQLQNLPAKENDPSWGENIAEKLSHLKGQVLDCLLLYIYIYSSHLNSQHFVDMLLLSLLLVEYRQKLSFPGCLVIWMNMMVGDGLGFLQCIVKRFLK